jgi:hypothetical protein
MHGFSKIRVKNLASAKRQAANLNISNKRSIKRRTKRGKRKGKKRRVSKKSKFLRLK